MTTYAEAERKMAELMREEMSFWHELHSGGGDQWQRDPGMEIPADKQEKYDSLKRKVERYGQELAADPAFMSLMSCWMVDVKCGENGETNPPTQEQFHEAFDGIGYDPALHVGKPRGFDKFVRTVGGGIASAVTDFLDHYGFRITDRGGGAGSWHVGVPCNDAEAFRLCSMLHAQFKKAIDAGMIRVVRMFWGWKLPTMSNWNDVEKYFEGTSW